MSPAFRLPHASATSTDTAPRRAGRLLAATGGLVLASALLVAGGPASAAPGDEHLAGLEYVALGDSYAAGLGLTPLSGTPVPGCGQSSVNYPHQVAAELGLTLTDVTCSGAETINLTTTAQTVPGGTAPVQNDSLSSTTDIVTVTIGGNDLGFSDIMTACAAMSPIGNVIGDPTDPFQLTDCESLFTLGGTDQLAGAITALVTPALNTVFADIAAKAPNATILVVGYPALTPSDAETPTGPAGCFTTALGSPFPVNSYPYTSTDMPYLHGIESLLDQAIAATATANGATMISLFDASSAHSPCAPVADQYVNGVTVESFTPPSDITLALNTLHPNAAGAEFQANQVMAAIRAAFPAPVAPDQPAEPAADEILPITGTDSAGWLALGGSVALVLGIFAVAGARRRSAK